MARFAEERGKNYHLPRRAFLVIKAIPFIVALGIVFVPSGAMAEVVDRIVANVNGDIILLSELQERRTFMNSMRRGEADKELTDEQALSDMIDERIIIRHAEENNITVKEEEVDNSVNNILKRNNVTIETLEETLVRQKMTMERYRTQMREQMLIQRVVRFEVTRKSVTDDELENYYARHPEEFVVEGRVRASHIVLLLSGNSAPEYVSTIQKRMAMIKRQIEEGADFAEMAQEYSQDGAAKKGGDLGWFSRGKMIPAFEKIAFTLTIGSVAGPVKTRFGLHLIKVTDREKPTQVPFSEAKDQIEQKIVMDDFNEKRDAWIKRLRKQAYIETID